MLPRRPLLWFPLPEMNEIKAQQHGVRNEAVDRVMDSLVSAMNTVGASPQLVWNTLNTGSQFEQTRVCLTKLYE